MLGPCITALEGLVSPLGVSTSGGVFFRGNKISPPIASKIINAMIVSVFVIPFILVRLGLLYQEYQL